MKIFLVLVALSASPAYASPASDFVQAVAGEYALAEMQPTSCPRMLSIEARDLTLTLKTETSVDYPYAFFPRIGKRYQRHNDDFGTYYDRRTSLKGVSIFNESRSCAGLIFISCSEWTPGASLTRVEPGLVHVAQQTNHGFEACRFRKR